VEELCNDLGCSTASFYTWKKRYGDASVAKAKRLRQLKRENDRLLNIVGCLGQNGTRMGPGRQKRLEIEGMREVLAKRH